MFSYSNLFHLYVIHQISTVFVDDIGGFRTNGTTFFNNNNTIATIIISHDSFLILQENNVGFDNEGVVDCQGVWIQEANTTCSEEDCPGRCCNFGDATCDLQTPSPSMAPSPHPSRSPVSLPVFDPIDFSSTGYTMRPKLQTLIYGGISTLIFMLVL